MVRSLLFALSWLVLARTSSWLIPTTFPLRPRRDAATMTTASSPCFSTTTSRRWHASKAPQESTGDSDDSFDEAISDDLKGPSKWDPSPLSQMSTPSSSTSRQRGIVTSLQVLTAVVSLCFVATLLFSQGRLLAVAPPVSQPPTPVNAEEILQQDWRRMSMTEEDEE